eukprot:11875455-Ditylum_brightwellii.AAC.1
MQGANVCKKYKSLLGCKWGNMKVGEMAWLFGIMMCVSMSPCKMEGINHTSKRLTVQGEDIPIQSLSDDVRHRQTHSYY